MQRIHIKHQALFSSKDKSKKKLKCRLLQFLFVASCHNLAPLQSVEAWAQDYIIP